MNSVLRKLPIGIQTFEDIRKNGYLYVDKTAFVWRIANTGKPYFLSRPRRFGKSLLLSTPESYFKGNRVDANNPIPLIYQSGYLTIKDYDKEFGNYLLEFPNDEVRYSFLDFLIPYYTSVVDDERGFYVGKFVRELETGDYNSFLTRLQAFFADFPYELNDKTERHYQVVFYLVFKLMGQFTDVEIRSARGRADAIVKTPKYIYVFEFKLNGTAEEALQQIDDKGYLIPYQTDGRELIKIGVEFSATERNISRWLPL